MYYAEEILQVKSFACFTDSHLVIIKKKNHKNNNNNKTTKTIYSKLIYETLNSQAWSTEQEAYIQAFIQPIFSGCFCFSRGP